MPFNVTIINIISKPVVIDFHQHTKIKRGSREHRYPKKLDIYDVDLPKALIVEVPSINGLTPKNNKVALTIPQWHNAMKEEYNALIDNNTWNLVPINTNMNGIGTK